jgi:hypothetical protein
MNGDKDIQKRRDNLMTQKGYHRFDRITTKIYGATGSNVVYAEMPMYRLEEAEASGIVGAEKNDTIHHDV